MMPPVIAVFFALQVLAHGHTLTLGGGLDPRTDAPRFRRSDPAPVTYTVRTAGASANWKRKPGVCHGTMIATVTGGPVRLRIAGVEQVLDTSWNSDYTVKAGTRMARPFVFLDPIGGAQLACRRAWVSCYEAGRRTAARMGTSICDPAPGAGNRDTRKSGPPRLAVRYPRHVMPQGAGVNAAYVRIHVELLGEITEEWWCPEIEVLWPNRTRSIREGDCDPWTGSPKQVAASQTWPFGTWLPSGMNSIRVTVSNHGRIIAREVIQVNIVGLGMPGIDRY